MTLFINCERLKIDSQWKRTQTCKVNIIMAFPNLSTKLFITLLPYNFLYVISYDEKKN